MMNIKIFCATDPSFVIKVRNNFSTAGHVEWLPFAACLDKGLKLIPVAYNDYNEETGLRRRHILCMLKRIAISIFQIEPLNPYLAQYLTKLFAKLMAYKALQLTRYP